ncbi:hypothetical protein [Marinobacterium iners]|uniref:hypothetical protein n=1 Tax=Marinobacterium iners TaxID=48076 RepID=UPI001115032A|nr:hypothetical protein [Marinobacterium iners]
MTILNMALEETRSDYGDYQLVAAPLQVTQERAFELVSTGADINIFWGMSSLRRETLARAVPFPLLRGLLGNRVLLINPEQEESFNRVHDIVALSRLVAIQGDNWPDTAILRHNGLQVLSSSDYDSLFAMLEYKRGDYFPRSIAEVWDELDSPLGEGFSVYPKLILQYSGPIYFFVSPRNKQLAERLQTGLERAWRSGRFNNLFYSRSELQKAFKFMKEPEVRVLRLSSPWKLPSLEQVRPEYWLPGSGF